MDKKITQLQISLNTAEEQELQAQNYLKINANLNQAYGNPVYIWYKCGDGGAPITRIQTTFDEEMCTGLINAGYIKVYRGLTPKPVFFWYYRGSTKYDTAIVGLEVSTSAEDEALKMKLGWERVGCNLSRAYGNLMYLWVKREKTTFICDVTATNSFGSDVDYFNNGYIRIDDTTNTMWWEKSTNFLWYRRSPAAKTSLSDLQISTNESEYQQWQQQGYASVSVNLNEGTGGHPVYLWYKSDRSDQVKSMLLLLGRSAIPTFEKNGVDVVKNNINQFNNGPGRFLCVLKDN